MLIVELFIDYLSAVRLCEHIWSARACRSCVRHSSSWWDLDSSVNPSLYSILKL